MPNRKPKRRPDNRAFAALAAFRLPAIVAMALAVVASLRCFWPDDPKGGASGFAIVLAAIVPAYLVVNRRRASGPRSPARNAPRRNRRPQKQNSRPARVNAGHRHCFRRRRQRRMARPLSIQHSALNKKGAADVPPPQWSTGRQGQGNHPIPKTSAAPGPAHQVADQADRQLRLMHTQCQSVARGGKNIF